MKIIADENMPLVEKLFGCFGQVERVAGRQITAEQLADAEVLLVRSVTKVDEKLLKGSQVKFVGSATIGTDHIDRQYLADNAIQFAYAPGCNAQAVAEYVLTAVAYWAEVRQRNLRDVTVGIIGAGNVGSKVAQVLRKLGVRYLLNDPPLQEAGDSRPFVALETIQQCDVVTCHVPLSKAGKHPTYHLIDQKFLAGMAEGSLLINSSRGAVLDNTAALQSKQAGRDIDFILDVWENEPDVNLQLLEQTLIATPHIAGYSQEGKIRGTYQLYQAYCQFKQAAPEFQLKELLPHSPKWHVPNDLDGLYQSLKPFYDIQQDDAQMRQVKKTVADEFDNLRKNYPQRLEFLELE